MPVGVNRLVPPRATEVATVVPMHVGVNRARLNGLRQFSRCPHACGSEPKCPYDD